MLETVIAVTIFWMCVSGIAALFVQTKQLSDKARSHYVAINLARNQLERAGSYTEPGQLNSLSLLRESNAVVNTTGASDGEGDFRRTTMITAGVSGVSNLTELVVTVEIRNRKTLGWTGEREVLRCYFTEYKRKT